MPRPRLSIPPGTTFGHLTVLAESDMRPRDHLGCSPERVLLCRCDCGEEREVYLKNLRSGSTISCGHVAKLGPARKVLEETPA